MPLYIKDENGNWVPGTIYPHDANGWKNAKFIYEKTGAAVWTQRWAADTTPPPAPTLSYSAIAKGKSYTLSIQVPNTPDVARVIVKYSTTGYPKVPSSAPETGATYNATVQTDGSKWSEKTVVPNETFQRLSLNNTAGNQIYLSAWVQDTSGNWSAPGTLTFKFPAYTAPTTSNPVNKSLTLNCSDSGTWMTIDNYWRSDNQYVMTGGTSRVGFWFFGTRISAALANAKTITKMTIRIQRVNTSHGVAGEANVRLQPHTIPTQGASPEGKYSLGTLVGTLARGESALFNVPSAWWPNFKSGTYKGLGLNYGGTTAFTSPEYIHCYGAGTASGQVHIEWQE
jgi:hypothetical protein